MRYSFCSALENYRFIVGRASENPLQRAIIQVAFAAPAKFGLLPTATATIRTKYRTAAFGDMLGTLSFPSPRVVGYGLSAVVATWKLAKSAAASATAARKPQTDRRNSCRNFGGD